MKKITIILFLISLKTFVYSQAELDKQMTKKAPNCIDIEYNCTQLIEKYDSLNKTDSTKIILKYWEAKCGLNESIIRIKILQSIKNNEFNENLYDSTIINFIKIYKSKLNNTHLYYAYSIYANNVEFDNFTSKLANKLLIYQKENTLEYLFCKFYSRNPNILFKELQTKDKYNNTKLKEYYNKEVDYYKTKPEVHLSMSSGVWAPLNKAKTLGIHPLIGFEIGYKYKKFTYNITMNMKFARTVNNYSIVLDDSTIKTNYFFGGYIGFDVDREIFKINKHELDLRLGIAYDGFSTLNVNTSDKNPNNDKGKSINSLNLNAGISYKYNFNNFKYIGVRGKYNFVQYKNAGGTNLSGNTITIELVFGGFTNYSKNYNLKALNY